MNILVSNDDGIDSPALLALVNELRSIGKVTVVAPNTQKSAFSHSMTIHGDIRYEKRKLFEDVEAYAIWGTPVDCVHIAIRKLCRERPDIVISGINQGPNMGTDLIYSGTVGAAKEGFLMGIPAIASSLCSYTSHDYQYAAGITRDLALSFVNHPDNDKFFLNLNVPEGKPKGIRVCGTIGWRDYDEGYESITKEDGYTYLVVGLESITDHFSKDNPDIDVNVVDWGYASLTPLMADQIAHDYHLTVKEIYEEDLEF